MTARVAPSDREPAEIRSDIATAALAAFMAHGYDRATMREIAGMAGMQVSSLYAHVSSKEALFLGLVRPVLEIGTEWIEAVAESDLSVDEKLRRACSRAGNLYDEHPEVAIYLTNHSGEISRATPELADRAKCAWEAVVRGCLGVRGDADEDGVRIVTYGILGMFSWMHRWYRPGGARSGAEIGETYAEILLTGLNGFAAGGG
jgi:TetR/AcrR family transcriptional regulator, cholesterol catabolism regulator